MIELLIIYLVMWALVGAWILKDTWGLKYVNPVRGAILFGMIWPLTLLMELHGWLRDRK